MRFRRAGRGYWSPVRTLRLDDPLGFTRAAVEPVIRDAACLDDVLDALRAAPSVDQSHCNENVSTDRLQ